MGQFELSESTIESQLEAERETFFETIEEISASLDKLNNLLGLDLTDEEIKRLATPGLKDKLAAFWAYMIDTKAAKTGIIGATLSVPVLAMLYEGGDLEKNLIALGVGTAIGAIAGISNWFLGEGKRIFNKKLSLVLEEKLYDENAIIGAMDDTEPTEPEEELPPFFEGE